MRNAKARRTGGKAKAPEMSHGRARLLAYRTCEGDVTFDDLKALARHFKACPRCRKEAGEIIEFEEMMRRLFRRRRRAHPDRCNPPPPARMLPPR